MSEFFKNFGLKIKEYREQRNLTQEKLCEVLDIATTTLSAWENGKAFPRKLYIIKLCNALEIQEEDLFCFKIGEYKNSFLDQAIQIASKIPPSRHKQVLEILKTFVD